MNPQISTTPLLFLLLPFSLAIPFYIGSALVRNRWGLLIPAWILSSLPIITPFSELVNPDLLASLYIFAIAMPFQVVYLVNRQSKWALIVAEVLGGVALVPLAGLLIESPFLTLLVVLAIGLPFLLISLVKNDSWPFIISGITINIGLLTLSNILTGLMDLRYPLSVISLLTIASVLLSTTLLITKESYHLLLSMLDHFLHYLSGLYSFASTYLGKVKSVNPSC
jgi:hypothetical protein